MQQRIFPKPFSTYYKSTADNFKENLNKNMETLYMKKYLLNKVENIVAKGEIAHNRQFFLLPQYFQKLTPIEVSDIVYMWERDKCI